MPHRTRKQAIALAIDNFRPRSFTGKVVLVSSIIISTFIFDLRTFLNRSQHDNIMPSAFASSTPAEKDTIDEVARKATLALREYIRLGDRTKLDEFHNMWDAQLARPPAEFREFRKSFESSMRSDPNVFRVIQSYIKYKKPKELDLEEVIREITEIHNALQTDFNYGDLKKRYNGGEAFLDSVAGIYLGGSTLIDLKKGAVPHILLDSQVEAAKEDFSKLEKELPNRLAGMDRVLRQRLEADIRKQYLDPLRRRLDELDKNPTLAKAKEVQSAIQQTRDQLRIGGYMAYMYSRFLYTGDRSFLDRGVTSPVGISGTPDSVGVAPLSETFAGYRQSFLTLKDREFALKGNTDQNRINNAFSLYLRAYTGDMFSGTGFENIIADKADSVERAETFGRNLAVVFDLAKTSFTLDKTTYADRWRDIIGKYNAVTGDPRAVLIYNMVLNYPLWQQSTGELDPGSWLRRKESDGTVQDWKTTANQMLESYGRVKQQQGSWSYSTAEERDRELARLTPQQRAAKETELGSENQQRANIEILRQRMTVFDAYFLDTAVRQLQASQMLSDQGTIALVDTLAMLYRTDPYLASAFLHRVVPAAAESNDVDGFVNILSTFRAATEDVIGSTVSMQAKRKFLLETFEQISAIPSKIAVYNTDFLEKELRRYSKDEFELANAFALQSSQLLGRDRFFQEMSPLFAAIGLFQTVPHAPFDPRSAAFSIPFLSSAEPIHSEVKTSLEGRAIPDFTAAIPAHAKLRRWTDAGFIRSMLGLYNDVPFEYAGVEPVSWGAGAAFYTNSEKTFDGIEQGYFETVTGGGQAYARETYHENPISRYIQASESISGVDNSLSPIHSESGYVNYSDVEGIGKVENDAVRSYSQIARNRGHNVLFAQEGYYRNYEHGSSSSVATLFPREGETDQRGSKLELESGSVWRRKARIGYSNKYGETILIATSMAKDNERVTYTPYDQRTGQLSSSSYRVFKDRDSSGMEHAYYTDASGNKIALPADLQNMALLGVSGTQVGPFWQRINNYSYARLGLEPEGIIMPEKAGVQADIKSMPFWKNPNIADHSELNGMSIGFDIGDYSFYGLKGSILEFSKGEKIFDQGGVGVVSRDVLQQHDAVAVIYRASVPVKLPGGRQVTNENYSQLDLVYSKLPPDQNMWAYFGRLMLGGLSPKEASLIPGAAPFVSTWEGSTVGVEAKAERVVVAKVKDEKGRETTQIVERKGYGGIVGHAGIPLTDLLVLAPEQAGKFATRVENYIASAYGYKLEHEREKARRIGLFAGGTLLRSKLTSEVRTLSETRQLTARQADEVNHYGSAMLIGWYHKHQALFGLEKVPFFIDAAREIENAQRAMVLNPESSDRIIRETAQRVSSLESAENLKLAMGYGWDDRVHAIVASDFKTMASMRAIALLSGNRETDTQWVAEAMGQVSRLQNPAMVDTMARLSFPIQHATRWFQRAALGAGPVFAATIPLRTGVLGEDIYTDAELDSMSEEQKKSQGKRTGTFRGVGFTAQGIFRVLAREDEADWEWLAGVMGANRNIEKEYDFYQLSAVSPGSSVGKRTEREVQILPLSAEQVIRVTESDFEKTNTYFLVDHKSKKVYLVDSQTPEGITNLAEKANVDSSWLFTVGFKKTRSYIENPETGATAGREWEMIVSAGPLKREFAQDALQRAAGEEDSLSAGLGLSYRTFSAGTSIRFGVGGGAGNRPNFYTMWDPFLSATAFAPGSYGTSTKKNPWWLGTYVEFQY